MPIAQNPDTGDVLYLDNGQWKPAQRAVNPKTREMMAFDGKNWVHVDEAAAKSVSKNIEGNYATETLGNIPESAIKAGSDIYNTVRHPIQTVENLGSLAKGISQKLGLSSGKDSIQYADAAWNYLKDRYGGVDAIKKSFHDDPVGVLLDASTVLSGGESLASRLPVVGGRAASVVRAVNPANVATKAVGGIASKVLGMTTGAESDAIKHAFRAGKAGGPSSQAFTEQMRGEASGADLVADAKNALSQLRKERGAVYQKEMAKVGGDKTVLNFDDIDNAVANTVARFKGKSVSPSVEAVQGQIRDVVQDWKALPADEYHTAEGLDALKKRIGDIQQNLPFNTPQRLAADKVYNAIKDTIVKQNPEYGKIMKGYQTASDEIKEVEKTLSLNPKANIDTSLRKITSALRNNVNTNFGRRTELVKFLATSGAPHLLTKIAGQALSSATPRGIVGRLGAMGIGAEALTAMATANPALAIKLSLAILAGSPRLVGEAAHGAGQAARLPVRNIGLGLRTISPGSSLEQSRP